MGSILGAAVNVNIHRSFLILQSSNMAAFNRRTFYPSDHSLDDLRKMA